MRMLMHVSFPPEPFNAAVREGTAGEKLQRILETVHPESVYFSEANGLRAGVLVVDVKDSTEIPRLAEPWFLTFDAKVELRVAMTPQELAKSNLDSIGESWR